MAKLIVNPTSPSRRELALSRSLVSIGRDPSNDVVLPDAMVSRRHAVIEYRGSQYFLRDCNSSNGSLINGDRISERGLRDGDLVAIGTARLLFRDDVVTEDAAGKVIHHPSSPRQQCPTCRQDYRKGDLFCRHCGSSLAPHAPVRTICTACGTAVPVPARFCTACGSRLGEGEEEPASAGPAEPPLEAPEGEANALAAPAALAPPVADDDGERETSASPVAEPLEALPAPLPHDSGPLRVMPGGAAPSAAPLEDPWTAPARSPLPGTLIPQPSPLSPLPDGPRPKDEPARDQWMTPRDVLQPTSGVFARSEPAGGLARLGAFVVDLLIVGAVQTALSLPALFYWLNGARRGDEPPADPAFFPILGSVTLAALAAILTAVYYVYFWGLKGATPGKRLFGLSVEGADGRRLIGPSRATLRLLGYGVSGLVFGIGFLMIAFGGNGLHDQIAATRVVRRRGA
jgi:uncharacterized RDD family membrane protein YckC